MVGKVLNNNNIMETMEHAITISNNLAGFVYKSVLKFKLPNTSLIKILCIVFVKVYISLNRWQVNSSAASVALSYTLIDVFTPMPQLSLSTTSPVLSMEYAGGQLFSTYFASPTPNMLK